VIQHLEAKNQADISNVPAEYLNFSIDKNNPNPNAIGFLQWVIQNGTNDLNAFGFLKPEPFRQLKEKQSEFVSKKGK
jgi:phosphate transport system substrate-binding protein